MEINYTTVGQRIQRKRKSLGVTQEQMAEALNFSVGYISQVERGITKLSMDSLANVCEYLGCDIGSIMEHTDDSAVCGYGRHEFMAMYDSLSTEDQRAFFFMLEVFLGCRKGGTPDK